MTRAELAKVPKRALCDALRDCNVGPSSLTRQDKADLVTLAEETVASSKGNSFLSRLDRAIADYQRDTAASKKKRGAGGASAPGAQP